MDYLDDLVTDLTNKLKAAKTEGCRHSWALKLVAAKWERGDYSGIIQAMTDEVKEALARQEMRAG
jgi:hypothetical protein